ncbi:MAG: ATP synthase F1 subunit delta, partial [Pseudomonadota bacterium]
MRYAQSLFELASEAGAVEKVEASLGKFKALISESGDLKRFVESPVLSADEQSAAIEAVLKKAKAEPLVANFLKVVSRNRRLFAVPAMIDAFAAIAADARGEASADVTSARELNATQTKQLQATLKEVACNCLVCVAFNSRALVTSALASPRASAAMAANASIM